MRSSSLLNFAWLAGALLASGCTVITSLDGWTFGDEDPGQTDGGAMDASQADAGPARLIRRPVSIDGREAAEAHLGTVPTRSPSMRALPRHEFT